MFEDSTFESQGRIRTRSRAWMFAALAFNGSILLALVLIPLIYPEALPRQAMAFLMTVPPPPTSPAPALAHQAVQAASANQSSYDPFQAPPRIPHTIFIASGPEPPSLIGNSIPGADSGPATPGGLEDPFHKATPVVVHQELSKPVRISTLVEEGLLVRKTMPQYPVIAVTMHLEGTVVLAATISKSGTIENLRAVSGPPVLQQAAIDAVKTWRYRPYLLDGQPVEVETSVNVVFTLGR